MLSNLSIHTEMYVMFFCILFFRNDFLVPSSVLVQSRQFKYSEELIYIKKYRITHNYAMQEFFAMKYIYNKSKWLRENVVNINFQLYPTKFKPTAFRLLGSLYFQHGYLRIPKL